MDALEFIDKYDSYIEEIALVVKPEYTTIIDKMRKIDPHDLIVPETWFVSERAARGFVWSLFLRRVKLSNKTE